MKEHPKKPARERRAKAEEKLDAAIEESFPASDPLPTNPTIIGGPEHSPSARPEPRARRRPARHG